jgi:FAD/FMN-containing dehydrogenase
VGWYARKYGLATNSVTAIELVTADGELVRADYEHEPDLFWALRGGGGNFGVVTAIEFDLYEIEEVYAGTLFFPWERTSEVLHAWHEWLPGLPDEVTSVGRVMQFPPLPGVLEPLRGNSFVIAEAAYLGTEADGAELLRPLRELGPVLDSFTMVPPVGLSELHMDPSDPVPYVSGHQLVGDLPAGAIDEFVAVVGPDSGSPLITVELRHLGGALARTAPHHGAVATLSGSFLMFAAGLVVDAASAAANDAQIALVTGALAEYDVGRYPNFEERSIDASRFFPPETYRRLQAVRAEYDPDELFRANYAIPPAR